MLTRLQLYEEFISHDVCMDFPKTCLQPKLIFCHYKNCFYYSVRYTSRFYGIFAKILQLIIPREIYECQI